MNKIKIDKLIRSRRRSISLMISPDATLTVRAPFSTALEYIEKLVAEKRDWINKKQMKILKNGLPLRPKKFEDGEEFFYLGKLCKFHFENRKNLGIKERRENVIAWYRRQALQKITERADSFSKITGWKYRSIVITRAERRWGSCGPKNSINFSWKLIMAPLDVVDYVVVHELAHISEKNHSKRFWKKVFEVLPGYKGRRKWLRENIGKFNI